MQTTFSHRHVLTAVFALLICFARQGAGAPVQNEGASITTGLKLSAAEYSDLERHVVGLFEVIVTRSGDTSSQVTVDYATRNGTAIAGVDYFPVSGTITFAPGVTQWNVRIFFRDDQVYEGTERFEFVLSNPTGSGATLESPFVATINIVDDEPPPALYMTAGRVQEPEAGKTSTALMRVALLPPSANQTVTVSYATSHGSATSGVDYVPTSGTLTFAPLEDAKIVPVPIIGDANNAEGSETFTMDLIDSTGAPIVVAVATMTIVDHLPLRPQVDFDGDTMADRSTYDPGNATWYDNTSVLSALRFGLADDVIVPADYTGDGRTDHAVWRPSTGTWWILQSEDSAHYAINFGLDGDVPVPADYDGDGRADIAIFRPSTGVWYILRSSDGNAAISPFGAPGDRPVPADYDGDWKADIAIFRPTNGQWWIHRSNDSSVAVGSFGLGTDRAVPADYSGDGKADLSVWRPSTGVWYVLRSEDGMVDTATLQPSPLYMAAPGDYNASGGFERALYANQPSARGWVILMAQNNVWSVAAGPGTTAVGSAYVR